MATAFTARNPKVREPFAARPDPAPGDRCWYRTEDGWEAPLWHLPARPGAEGLPVILAHGLAAGPTSFTFDHSRSLAHALRQAGFDVYLLEHRGDRNAIPPLGAKSFDFDAIAEHDVPAAIAAVRERTGAERVFWVGHAMGGQLLYAHLGRGGAGDVAAAVTLCAPVRFEVPRSHARMAAVVARLLPPDWRVPSRTLNRALASLASTETLSGLGDEGPVVRGLMVHSSEDLGTGLVRQLARWVSSGSLCDRGNRLDYVDAMRGASLPLLGVAAWGDPLCPPDAAWPALDALDARDVTRLELGPAWGHFDPITGAAAPDRVFPEITRWLLRWRQRCWER